jgi:hypothetical protein
MNLRPFCSEYLAPAIGADLPSYDFAGCGRLKLDAAAAPLTAIGMILIAGRRLWGFCESLGIGE